MKRCIVLLAISLLIYENIAAQTTDTAEKHGKPSHPFTNVLIVSLIKNYENRKTVESELTWWINSKGFNATPCVKFLTSEMLPTKDNIKDIVDKNGFDAVMVSSVVDIEIKEKHDNTPQFITGPMTPTFYNYLDNYNYIYSLGYTYNTKSFIVETNLFDVATETAVLRVTSKTFESENLETAIESFARSLAKTLKKSKLLGKKPI